MLIDIESSLNIDNACCVDEALKKLSTINYDIVVSDYEMPQKNGLEFLKELREQNNKIPFILFTGKGSEEVAIQALNIGADGYYNKQGSPETVYGELCHGIIQTFKRNRAEKAHEKALFLSLIVEDSDDAIIGKTLNGSITSWNKSAERIYGYSEAEALGKSIQMLAPPQEKEGITQILKKIGAGELIKHYQTKRVRKDGVIIDVSLSISPIRNEAGTIIGASTIARDMDEYRSVPIFNDGEIFEWVGTCIDITERKKAEKTLLESEHLLAESERIGKVGGWKINIDTNKLTWTDETYRIHEVDHNFKPTIENGVGFYTSESRIIIEQAVEQAIAHGKSFDLELQITTAKGNIRSIRVIGEGNNANRVVQGFFQDITERKKAEAALLLNEIRLQSSLDINKMLDASAKELMDFALEAITKSTQSEFAFIDLLGKTRLL